MRNTTKRQLGSIATVLIVTSGGAIAAPAHKTPRECNSELYTRLAAIKAAGETPARFVHDCWWHSQPGQPTALASPDAASREVEAAAPAARIREPRWRAQGLSAHRVALARRRVEARRVEARRLERLRQRVARAVRAARLRLALEQRAVGTTELRGRARHRSRWSVAANEPRHSPRRERLAAVPVRLTAPIRQPETSMKAWTERPDSAVAELGPSARAGRRMWVRVVAAGEVAFKPAVAVGGLADRATGASALNCWGQQVLFLGRASSRWSREMVCDDKPAGANEWSAQIYYGGPAAR